jgi:hypothetical protein
MRWIRAKYPRVNWSRIKERSLGKDRISQATWRSISPIRYQ